MSDYVQPTHKFVAVLNKKIPEGRLMNALAHATAGLSATYPEVAAMRFDNYEDKSGNIHQSISDNPFIILRADNSNKLRALRQQLVEQDICFTDFVDTMTEGTYTEQQERTKNTNEEDLEYFAVVMFGENEVLNVLNKKFSLWH
ncbi:MAG: DUF2000 domain-containing protein [Candidatus Saccharibacteria bacterium]